MKNATLAGLAIAALIAIYIIFKTTIGPQGIRAICIDGTVSLSKSNQGTCSNHKGVLRWIKDE